MSLHIGVRSWGLAAPGLSDWATAQPLLQDLPAAQTEDFRYAPPEKLPRNERRRATRITRLAFSACADALREQAVDAAAGLRTVFATCSGDMDTLDAICRALAQPEIALSPLQFHNSVHNATAGYWSIASAAHGASTSISAHDGTFAAGLLEAATQIVDEPESDVLLVCYDIPPPQPLQQGRPVTQPFALALLLGAAQTGAWQLALAPSPAPEESTLPHPEWEQRRLDNAAARSLPLLHRIARSEAGCVDLPAASGLLRVHCTPQPQ